MCPARVMILGVDAADPRLLEEWTADGTLPHLAGAAARGCSGKVESIPGFFVGSTWPSFQTGLSPAGHGVHYLAAIQPGSYTLANPYHTDGVRGEPFWTTLSRAGHRVAVLDVPLSRLDPEIAGIQLVEWGGHDSIYGFQAHPRTLEARVLHQFGAHPLGPTCDGPRPLAADWEAFTGQLVLGCQRRAELTRHLLAEADWDCLIQVFTEAHCAGHQAWHLHDPAHPAHRAELAAATGNPLRRVYQAVDAAIGAILEDAGDASVLIVSLHGMGPWHGAPFLLPEILARLGVTTPVPPPAGNTPRARAIAAARVGWKMLPEAIRSRLRPLRRRILPDRPRTPPTLGIVPGQSRCFAVGNGAPVGAIRLNLRGREAKGQLNPGAEAEEFEHRLIADLAEIVDDRTDKPAIRQVVRSRELFDGPELARLPDLLVEWDDRVATGSMLLADGAGAWVSLRSPRIGVVEGVNWFGRSGDHRPGGKYFLLGPGTTPGVPSPTVAVTRFAAAILGAVQRGVPLQASLGSHD